MRVRLAWVLVGFAVAMGSGCLAVLGVEDEYTLSDGHGGAGGSGAGVQGGSGGQGGSGAQGGTAGQGGSGECSSPAECPGSDTTCQYRVCADNTCFVDEAAEGTACTEAPGQNVCDGSGNCVECNDGADCGGGDTCADHFCVAEHCTNGVEDGGETDLNCGGPDCAPCNNGDDCNVYGDCVSGFCDNGTCAPCGDSFDCAGTQNHCDTGVCVPDVANGEPCNYDTWCLGGICQDDDDVCCNAECTANCESCLEVQTGAPDGTCAPVLSGPGDCPPVGCLGSGSEVLVAGSCNGSSTDCSGEQVVSCGAYDCDPGTDHCRTSCNVSSECAGPYYCNSADDCVPEKGDGEACASSDECDSNECRDQVCCDNSCGGLCRSCLGSKTGGQDGNCGFVTAGTDPDNECADPTPNCNGSGACS